MLFRKLAVLFRRVDARYARLDPALYVDELVRRHVAQVRNLLQQVAPEKKGRIWGGLEFVPSNWRFVEKWENM